MANATNVSCVSTTIRNMSGKTAVFGFLPPHGKRLIAGEEYTFFGSVDHFLQGITSKRKRVAFEKALKAHSIVVVSSPTPFLYDTTLDVTKTIKIDNGSVAITDPCGVVYSSSIV